MPKPFSNENAARLNALNAKNKTNEGLTKKELAEYRAIEAKYEHSPKQLIQETRDQLFLRQGVVENRGLPMADRLMALGDVLRLATRVGTLIGRQEGLGRYIPDDIQAWLDTHAERVEEKIRVSGADELSRAIIEEIELENTAEQLQGNGGRVAPTAAKLPGAANIEAAEAGESRAVKPNANTALRWKGVSLAVGEGGRRRKRKTRRQRRKSRQ